jgi:TrmH family RNA methyltransferase
VITSASNDKIKEIKKLIKSASRRKETGLYIVEGIRMVREIPADAVKTLYVAESMTDKFADICNQIPAEVEIVSFPEYVGYKQAAGNSGGGISDSHNGG